METKQELGEKINIGKIIKDRRIKCGLTLIQLGKYVDVSPTYLTKIELYGEFPSPKVLKKLLIYLKFNFIDGLTLAIKIEEEKVKRYREKIHKAYQKCFASTLFI